MSSAPPIAFSHVGIFVTDLRAMEDFYSRVLGLTVTDRGDLGDQQLVFLSRDPGEHHQVVLVSGRPERTPFNVVNQLSFRVASLQSLREFHARLDGEPASEIAPVTHGNAVSLYFRDPEGNRIELYLDTPWYVNQPMRIPIDLAQDDRTIWRQIEEAVRALPGFRPQDQWRAETARRMGLA